MLMRIWIAKPRGAGMSAWRKPELGERAPPASCELELDQVDAGHFLGHRVLDLEARVRLDESELGVVAPRIGVDQELERAEAVVADRLGHLHGRGGEPGRAARSAETGAGRDLDELLIAPLDACIRAPTDG